MDIKGIVNKLKSGEVKYKSQLAVILAAGALIFAQDYARNNLTIFSVNDNKYTYADISELANFSSKAAEINGVSKAPTKDVVFQSLVIASVEKEILNTSKAQVNKEVAIRMVMEGNPYRGLLEASRKKLGEDRFYKLFVEPLAVGGLFQQYYSNKDPQRQLATETLTLAKSIGVAAAAQKIGIQPQEIAFARNQQNENLYSALKQTPDGGIAEKLVEDGDNFYVIQSLEVADQGARASAIVIPRTAPGVFIASEIKSKGINVSNTFYSLYRISDLAKPGMIFAAKTAETKDQKDAKK